jgi:hypothetical protein
VKIKRHPPREVVAADVIVAEVVAHAHDHEHGVRRLVHFAPAGHAALLVKVDRVKEVRVTRRVGLRICLVSLDSSKALRVLRKVQQKLQGGLAHEGLFAHFVHFDRLSAEASTFDVVVENRLLRRQQNSNNNSKIILGTTLRQ